MRSMTWRLLAAVVALATITAACSSSDDYSDATPLAWQSTTALSATEGFNSIGGTATVNDEPYDLVFFDNYGINPRIDTIDDALSTFAVDVDTGS